MGRDLLKLLIVLSGIIFSNYLMAAEDETKADKKAVLTAEVIIYDYDKKALVAQGNALLKYEDTIIRGSELMINVDDNIIESLGATELEQDEIVIKGDNLFYNLSEEKGRLMDFYFERVSETGEPMFISGEEMEVNKDVFTYNQSFFTACDRENPHYHLTAKKVEYYPGDRIVFYHIKYYEGKYHVFSWPKLVVSLKEEENNFSETVFGYNEIDGWYLKVVYRYYLNSVHNGRLLLDLIERRGIGEGVLHNFELDEGRQLSLSLYHFANKVTFGDDYQLGLNWEHDINSLYSYSLEYEYWLKTLSYGGGYDWWNEEYSLYGRVWGRDKKWPFNATLDTGVYGMDPIFYVKPKLNLEWRPTGDTRLVYSGLFDYKKPLNEGDYFYSLIDKKYRYTLSLYHNWSVDGGEPFRFRAELYEAMDLSPEPNPSWRDWNRTPYLSLETPQFNMAFLGDYRIKMDYLRLREVPSLIEGERGEFILTRRDQPILKANNFTLSLVGSLRKQVYWVDEGEYARRALTFGVEGVQRFTPQLSWKNRLTWTEADGEAPTGFYQLVNNSSYYMPHGNFRSGLYYQNAAFRANLEGGYNLSGEDNPWHLVTTSANWDINQANRLDFNTSYNPNTKEFGNVTLIARYQPDNHNYLRLDMIYNPRDEVWSTLDLETKLRQNIMTNLQADINVLYSFFGDGLERSRLGLVYDWHCREVYVGYDTIRREYSFQFQYKVFPNAGFGLGNSDPGFSLGRY